MLWHRIINVKEWFGEMAERYRLVRDFNKAAKMSFITGEAPTLLQARITKGGGDNRHAFSRFLAGGFRIKAMSGRSLAQRELIEIGRVILDNEDLVRKLVALGWDTLEVHANVGYTGARWALKDHVKLGGWLGEGSNA